MNPQTKQETKYKAKSMMKVISDKMDVATAKIRGEDGSDLDVAVVKATLQDEVVPKEKHVKTLKIASSGSAPRAQVDYVIHALGKRLEGSKGEWLVTLKTLIVFHRLMREVDPTFQDQILKYCERTGTRRLLRLDGFADHTTKDTWDLSAWIRCYSVYLDERLDTFRVMKFDPEDAGAKEAQDSMLKSCTTPELLERLPLVQKLLNKLIACVPQGHAQVNEIAIFACSMVLKELRSIYKAVCEGIMNLADKFFEMEHVDAVRGLEQYKENVALNEKLNAFFSAINGIGALRGAVTFPTLQALPTDFQTTLEDYVKEAPKSIDPNAPGGSSRKALVTGGVQAVARQGGVTSQAIGGTAVPAAVPVPAPVQGVLKIGGPITDGPAPAAAAAEVDLLGADLASVTVSSPPPQQHQAQQQHHHPLPAQDSIGANSFFNSPGVWAQAAPTGHPQHPQQQALPPAATNPFGSSVFPAPQQQQQQQQQYTGYVQQAPAHQPPPAAGGFTEHAAFGAPSPQGPPAASQAAASFNPFNSPQHPAAPPAAGAPPPLQISSPPQHPHSAAPTPPSASNNPFGVPAAFSPQGQAPAPYGAPSPAYPPAPSPAYPAPSPAYGAPSTAYGAPSPAYGTQSTGQAPQGFPAPPAPMAPYGAPSPYGAPQAAQGASNPFGASGFGAPAAFPPQQQQQVMQQQQAPSANPFGANNPFGGAPSPAAGPTGSAPGMWGAPAAPQPMAPSAWPGAPTGAPAPMLGQQMGQVPGSFRNQQPDPLQDLSFDLLGRPPPPKPALKDIKPAGQY